MERNIQNPATPLDRRRGQDGRFRMGREGRSAQACATALPVFCVQFFFVGYGILLIADRGFRRGGPEVAREQVSKTKPIAPELAGFAGARRRWTVVSGRVVRL